ncbi:MAG TPA: hypothetical protein VKR42_05010 [Ktedonobacteraceae bacterium]|nr:hypothetical protein [Ktedonobacteraceae bacterium]
MTISILALEKDLFFSVKIRDTLKHHAMLVTIVRTLAAFEQRLAVAGDEKPALVIIDTATAGVDWEAAIRQAGEQHIPVLAFGSHMDLEARAKALQAGAQRVVANSKFSSDMPGLVQRMLSQPTAAPSDDPDDEE